MSVAEEITRLQTAKANIKTAIEGKGVQVPSSALLSTYNTYINQIQTGGGQSNNEICETMDLSDYPSSYIQTESGAFKMDANQWHLVLKKVKIPSGFSSIYTSTFQGYTGLTSVEIPSTVTTILNQAFYRCSGISVVGLVGCGGIELPNTLTSIQSTAFSQCTGLTSVTIPSSVTSIGDSCFNGCTHLSSFTCEATTPPTLGINAFTNTAQDLTIYVPSASVETYKTASRWSDFASRIQAIQ